MIEELFRWEEYASVSYETVRTIAIMTDNTKILKKIEEADREGDFNMCKAVDDMEKHWVSRRKLS